MTPGEQDRPLGMGRDGGRPTELTAPPRRMLGGGGAALMLRG
jgi:hypothetical protein